VNHLRQRCEQTKNEVGRPHRGYAKQRVERNQEQTARLDALNAGTWLIEHGWTWTETANVFHLSPRTLRDWRHNLAHDRFLPQALGRPVFQSSREQRNEVIHFIDELGPAIGLSTLRACFPKMLRAELEDLLRRYRRVWRKRNREPLRVLHWPVAGRVWAIDFTGPLAPVDGLYPYLLAVRDLASGRQLLWLPTTDPTAAETVNALASLFATHGAPLVLKSDNGSAFIAEATRELLVQFGVGNLYSPPGMPKYNGSIEAGIGSLKARTEDHAARHGRPGQWTWDDVEAARWEANATARPRGLNGPTPDQSWAARQPIGAEERTLFRATVERLRQEVEPTTAESEEVLTQRATDRQAIRRALEQHGYLHYTRKRIPLPIPRPKAAPIT
jgi:transposase InsO family protein